MFWCKTMWFLAHLECLFVWKLSNKDLLRRTLLVCSACAKKGSVYETHMLQCLIHQSGAHRHRADRAEAVELLDSCSCIGDACKSQSNQDTLKHNNVNKRCDCWTSAAIIATLLLQLNNWDWSMIVFSFSFFCPALYRHLFPPSFSFSFSSFRLDLCVSAISMYFSCFVIVMLAKGCLFITHINIVCTLRTTHQDILSCVEF